MEPKDQVTEQFNEALVILKRRIKDLQGVMADARKTIERCDQAKDAAVNAWEASDAEATQLIWAVEVLERKGETNGASDSN